MKQGERDFEQLSCEVAKLRGQLQELEMVRERCRIAEECLLEWEMRFRALTQSQLYGILSLDSDLRITFFNQGATRIFGYAEYEVVGSPIALLIPDFAELVRRIHDASLIRSGKIWSIGRPFESRGTRKTGEIFSLELCLSSWNSRAGVSYCTIIRDVTYRNRMLEMVKLRTEEARRRTEELETLIQTLAHDLKSPVVTVRGLSSLLIRKRQDAQPDPEGDQILGQIAASAQSMETFLGDFLEGLSAPHTKVAWAPLNLVTIIEKVIRQHEQELEEGRVTVVTHLEESLPEVFGDKQQIVRVLDNLLTNAIRYMGRRSDPLIRIRCRTKTSFVLVSVTDNGIGIPPELHSKIFDRFFKCPRPDGGGSGLGLFIARKFVESHQGRIWVESQVGSGTTFSFTLPKFIPGEPVDYEI